MNKQDYTKKEKVKRAKDIVSALNVDYFLQGTFSLSADN